MGNLLRNCYDDGDVKRYDEKNNINACAHFK